jgi:hypothetical protein
VSAKRVWKIAFDVLGNNAAQLDTLWRSRLSGGSGFDLHARPESAKNTCSGGSQDVTASAAWLMHLLFVDDPTFGRTSGDEWDEALPNIEADLGLTGVRVP